MNKLEIPHKNLFYSFCAYDEYVDDIRITFENEIKDFIIEEWSPTEYYVELEDTHILSITIFDDIRRKCFENYIINPICEKYALEVKYVETVESSASYIEWGLGLKNIGEDN